MGATSEMDRLTAAAHGVPQVGERCFGFELVEQLGEGKFSRVYLARQANLANRLVVVKITTDLWAESERLARLQHTNIVPIYSVHQQALLQAVCMPFFGRQTLADVLQRMGDRTPLVASEVVELFTDAAQVVAAHSALRTYLQGLSYEQLCLWIAARVADGLSHAHERGILHRDLKPANILMTEEGQPMILDFNLSEDMVAGGTASLLVGGTLPYMSPEHLQAVSSGSHVDLRGDIYSLGVILFQMLTGRLPFSVRGGSIDAVLPSMIAERSSPPPSRATVRTSLQPSTRSCSIAWHLTPAGDISPLVSCRRISSGSCGISRCGTLRIVPSPSELANGFAVIRVLRPSEGWRRWRRLFLPQSSQCFSCVAERSHGWKLWTSTGVSKAA